MLFKGKTDGAHCIFSLKRKKANFIGYVRFAGKAVAWPVEHDQWWFAQTCYWSGRKTNKRRAPTAKFIYSIAGWSQPRTLARRWYIKYVLLRGIFSFCFLNTVFVRTKTIYRERSKNFFNKWSTCLESLYCMTDTGEAVIFVIGKGTILVKTHSKTQLPYQWNIRQKLLDLEERFWQCNYIVRWVVFTYKFISNNIRHARQINSSK